MALSYCGAKVVQVGMEDDVKGVVTPAECTQLDTATFIVYSPEKEAEACLNGLSAGSNLWS